MGSMTGIADRPGVAINNSLAVQLAMSKETGCGRTGDGVMESGLVRLALATQPGQVRR